MTTDFVSPAWIAISRGFDEMVKLLLDPAWNAKLVAYLKEETVETLAKNPECGVQQTHYDLANTRRYWKCVHHLEHALGVLPNANFDNHDAFSSAVRRRCAKSCARALIGMLIHERAADIFKIDNENLRKVCADLFNASTAAIAPLYH